MTKKTKKFSEEDLLIMNLKDVLDTGAGKEIIWHILGMCDIYTPVSGDIATGKRQVGLDLLLLLQDVHPTTYANLQLTMMEKENA